MFTIIARRTEDLEAADRAAIIRACVAAFGDAEFERLFSYIPSGGLHLIGSADGQVVSHAVVTTRRVQPEGLPLLRTAYVDAVATTPTAQGHGYGSAVLRALADAVAATHEIACLETERVSFYTRLGWQRWRGPRAGRGETGLIPTPDEQNILILRLPQTPALDLDRLLTIECQRSRIW